MDEEWLRRKRQRGTLHNGALPSRHRRGRTRRSVAWTAVVAVVSAITFDISPVYLGYHWPKDVHKTWLLGALRFTLVITPIASP